MIAWDCLRLSKHEYTFLGMASDTKNPDITPSQLFWWADHHPHSAYHCGIQWQWKINNASTVVLSSCPFKSVLLVFCCGTGWNRIKEPFKRLLTPKFHNTIYRYCFAFCKLSTQAQIHVKLTFWDTNHFVLSFHSLIHIHVLYLLFVALLNFWWTHRACMSLAICINTCM